MPEKTTTQSVPLVHRLVNQTKAEYEYDPATALNLYWAVQEFLPEKGTYSEYRDADWMDDEGRIVNLFELLNQSLFGDVIFGSLATDDQWSDLHTQREDE